MTGEHAALLRAALDTGDGFELACEEAFCLAFSSTHPGLGGLGAWPAETVSRCGNLHERNYSVQDVARALEALVHVAPSMLLKVHCGGDWESEECVATISVGEGLVVVGKPERATVDAPSEGQVMGNFFRNLLR
jgi:hypothetical protein